MKISLLIIAVCFIFQINKAQTTVTLQCSQDAAIGFHDGANTSGNNYGTAIQDAAFMVPASADPNGYNGNRALIGFNLSALPSNAILISASLNLYAIGPFGTVQGHFGTANSSYLQRITQNWGELTATWNNQPSSVTQNQVTLSQSSSATQDYLNINVTTLVQDMLNSPSSSFGFLLKLVTEVSYNGLCFASRDHSNTALHPSLVLVYRICSEAVPVAITGVPDRPVCIGSPVQLTASGANTYTWLANQVPVTTGATVNFTPQMNTTYTVNATDANGCQGSSLVTVNVMNCTGIKELESKNTISLYPNPSSGVFTIAFEAGNLTVDEIQITDLQGQLIETYKWPNDQSSLEIKNSELKPGIYFCKVVKGSGHAEVKKFIIQ